MNTPDKSKSQDRTLTTTSFAVLSVLAMRDHSTYDITRQMRLSMHYMWPRAESNVYAEPSRLVGAGLAEAREEWVGRRRRTIYSITDAGRAALAGWLASPSAPPRYECEALVKVLFAENGTPEDLLASIRALGQDAATVMRHFLDIADLYAANQGEYPARIRAQRSRSAAAPGAAGGHPPLGRVGRAGRRRLGRPPGGGTRLGRGHDPGRG